MSTDWADDDSSPLLSGRQATEEVRVLPPIQFYRLRDDACYPVKASEGAAGYDLVAIAARRFGKGLCEVSTGIAAVIPEGYVGLVRGRSGLAFKHGIWCFEGTIDSDYRGEIKVLLKDVPSNMSVVRDRVAQLVVVPVLTASALCPGKPPDDTQRGAGGFGSTGR